MLTREQVLEGWKARDRRGFENPIGDDTGSECKYSSGADA